MVNDKNLKGNINKLLFYLNLLFFLIAIIVTTSVFLLANLLNLWEKNVNSSFIGYLLFLGLWGLGIFLQGRRLFKRNIISKNSNVLSEKVKSEDKVFENSLDESKAENPSFTLREYSSNEKIDLSSKGLSTVPDYFKNNSDLKALYLYGNKIENLPDFIGNLKSLEVLDLTGNELQQLPDSIGNLLNLKKLDLSFNKLTQLPDSIGKLVNLEILKLINNELTSLPDSIGELRNLREFYFLGNNIKELPDSIRNLKKLEVING